MPSWKKVITSGSNAILNNITNNSTVANSKITGSFTGSFVGDGSSLTGLSAFPHSGSALVTGSLGVTGSVIISKSNAASGAPDSTALRVFGSGSISQSGIFEVEGAAGPLFTVQDGLDGVLMEVNNISGLPLFQVSSSNEVFINRGNLTSGVTTATASFSNFSGSFQGDGSNLTGVSAFPFSGSAKITGSAEVTGSLSVSGSSVEFKASGGTVFSIAETGSFTLGEGAYSNSDSNVAVGKTANAAGSHNIAIGNASDNDGQSYNIAIGSSANTTNTSFGIAIGGSSYAKGSTIAIGHSAAGGTGDVAIGYDAGSDSGDYNILLGYAAGKSTTGDANIIIGSGSLGAASMTNQLRIGHASLHVISGSLATGDVIFANNVTVGGNLTNDSTVANSKLTGSFTGSLTGLASNATTATTATTATNAQGLTGTPNISVGSFVNASEVGESFLTGSFTGSFVGDGSSLTGISVSTPTLDAVTTAGSTTANNIQAGAISGSSFKLNNANALSFSGNILYVGNANDWTTVELGRESTDEIHANGIFKAEQNLIAEQNAQISGSALVTGSLGVTGSISTNLAVTASHGLFDTASIEHLTVGTLISASTLITTGSNTFGDAMDDVQTLVGTTKMTGSANVTGSFKVQGTSGNILSIANDGTFTLGEGATAGNDAAVSIGKAANAASNGISIGPSATSIGNAISIGGYSSVAGDVGVSIGYDADSTAAADGSISIGAYINNSAGRSAVFNATGENAVNHSKASSSAFYLSNKTNPDFEIVAGGSSTLTGSSLTIENSGSTVFNVIGSEGTLFSVDDDLDGTIFTANDKTGLPVLEASASGEVYIGKAPQSLYTTAVISATTSSVTQSIYALSTSSYGGSFFDYTVQSGSNARAGSIMSVWNGANISFTETTTLDIGDTSGFNLVVKISQSQAQLAQYSSTDNYNIKTIIRSI